MRKILLADDQAASRELLGTVLANSGYEVIEAADGIEALERAGQNNPHLILLDLQMPKLDGFGVIRALRADARFQATPIVAITASAMHGDRERAMAQGFTSYLTKPIRLPELRKEVARLLNAQ
ncbi:MAG TPA: response regulator [Bryobacteraceae bacterium]|jgi:CheY-like chemotaxis protein